MAPEPRSAAPAAAATAAAAAPARVIPFPHRAQPPSPAAARSPHADYWYVKHEIRRIAILAAGIVVLIIVLSFVLG